MPLVLLVLCLTVISIPYVLFHTSQLWSSGLLSNYRSKVWWPVSVWCVIIAEFVTEKDEDIKK